MTDPTPKKPKSDHFERHRRKRGLVEDYLLSLYDHMDYHKPSNFNHTILRNLVDKELTVPTATFTSASPSTSSAQLPKKAKLSDYENVISSINPIPMEDIMETAPLRKDTVKMSFNEYLKSTHSLPNSTVVVPRPPHTNDKMFDTSQVHECGPNKEWCDTNVIGNRKRFLLYLSNHMKEMNESQKRAFKQRLTYLVEDVLTELPDTKNK